MFHHLWLCPSRVYISIFTYAQCPRARSGSIRLALCKKEVVYMDKAFYPYAGYLL